MEEKLDVKVENIECFLETLGGALIENKKNLVSSFGVGVGPSLIKGVLNVLHNDSENFDDDRLTLKIFPQNHNKINDSKELWLKHRRKILATTGIVIFLFGSKYDSETGELIDAKGVFEEFEIARENKRLIVPIGLTGGISKKIWGIIDSEFEDFYFSTNKNVRELFGKLNCTWSDETNIKDIIDNIINFINLIQSSNDNIINKEIESVVKSLDNE